ncbi:hypothetical protein [Caballeronia sordidicola]|nr:hypothetical protein [Caballeronia sordidicola]
MLGAVTMFSGCASIIGGSSQSVSVQTTKGETMVAGAMCTLTNDKGTWFAMFARHDFDSSRL